MAQVKTIVFLPINSPGHTNSSIHLADQLQRDYGYKCIFLFVGPSTLDASVRDRGHEIITLKEAEPYEDYELVEDPETGHLKLGSNLITYEGFLKYPRIVFSLGEFLRLKPIDTFRRFVLIWKDVIFRDLITNNDSISREVERINPDLIITDNLVPPACLVLNQNKRPWVRLQTPNPLMLTKSRLFPDDQSRAHVKPWPFMGQRLLTKEERCRLRRDEPDRWEAMVDEWRQVADCLKPCIDEAFVDLEQHYQLNKCQMDRRGGQLAIDSPHLSIYMYPEALDYDQDDDLFVYSSRLFRCDSLIKKSLGSHDLEEVRCWSQKLDHHMKGRESMIYISLGSIASSDLKLVRRLLDLLEQDDQQSRLYVVSKGVNGDKFELNASNMIGANYLPQTYLLERAQLAIIHGGNNSITECMFYGVPMVVLPVFTDQLDNGQRVEDLNYGRRLNVHNCTRDQLLAAIDELLHDQQVARKMQQVREKMQSHDDSKKITRLLDKLAKDKCLEQSFIDEHR